MVDHGSPELPVLPYDRQCRASSLDNPLRHRFSPPSRLVDLLALREGETVADLGAGVGYYDTEILARLGPRGKVYLVDIDEENLAVVRGKEGSDARVDVHVGSAAQVPWIPDGTVDHVLLSLVLCCLSDKGGALDEAWRILRPGGTVIATFPWTLRVVRPGRPRRLGLSRELFLALATRHPWGVEWLPGHVVRKYRLTKPRGP